MSLSVYKCYEYDHTHENEQFRALAELLARKYYTSHDEYLLIGNLSLNGSELDAILFKSNAIIILEFKNYGGTLCQASENGDWLLDDQTIVKGGASGKNPFAQTKNNKWAAGQFFDNNFPFSSVEYRQISGVVVFNQGIVDTQASFSPNIKSWFHISDMNRIVNKIDDISSTRINLSTQDIESIPSMLGLNNSQWFDLSYLFPPTPAQTTTVAQSSQTATFPSTNFQSTVRNCIANSGYTIVHNTYNRGKNGIRRPYAPLNLSTLSQNVLDGTPYNGEIWKHQYEAIECVKRGKNLCIATATSSGKTLVFQIAALETIAADDTARILAIYPQKSLSSQQLDRWERILPGQVGIIDGNHKDQAQRMEALRNAKVIVMTPDTVHAYILGFLNHNQVGSLIKNFLRGLQLVIVDEIHSYTGVFGTNSQYMFRRLNMCVDLCKQTQINDNIPLQYITASATIKDPDLHSQRITNVQYALVDQTYSDVSARYTYLLRGGDRASATNGGQLVSLLSQFVTQLPNKKFISFIDSRQSVARTGQQVNSFLANNNLPPSVLSYRSGYELSDSTAITNNINNNQFSGIVSTSAMEIGIDLPQLDIVVLYGVPENATSYYQRVGRVGRTGGGTECVTIIVDNGTFQTSKVFDNPNLINNLPIIEAALYSTNEKVINRNLKCIFDNGNGEYPFCNGDVTTSNVVQSIMDKHFSSVGSQQAPFSTVCFDWIINGQYPNNYMTDTPCGGIPNLEFSLRSFDAQFCVRNLNNQGAIINPDKGSINYNELIREAYPGAIWDYNHQSRWRVCRVDEQNKTVLLFDRSESNINKITKPDYTVAVWPQGQRIKGKYTANSVRIYNPEVLVCEQTRGFVEMIGNTINRYQYPMQTPTPTRYLLNTFSRRFETSGVLIFHNSLDCAGVECSKISQLLFEIFLQSCAFERSEVSYLQPNANNQIESGHRYVGLYDDVVGGLCITNRLLEFNVLAKAFAVMDSIVSNGDDQYILQYPIQNNATKDAIRTISTELNSVSSLTSIAPVPMQNNCANITSIDVINIDSVGTFVQDGSTVTVIGVYYDRNFNDVLYEYDDGSGVTKICMVAELEPIIGTSEKIQFDLVRSRPNANTITLW